MKLRDLLCTNRSDKSLYLQLSLSFFVVVACVVGPSECSLIPKNYASRVRRSPNPGGLFGLSPPSNLADTLKPVTFADLNAIKDQLKGFDVFSKRLDEVIAAEKQARNGFQKLIDSAKEQISNLENAVNPDDKNFWGDSQSCGGIIVAQTGKISYKTDTTYENYEKCVWTIRVNYRSKVKLQLVAEGLEKNGFIYDQITVSEVDDGGVGLKTVKLTANQKYLFQGPVLIVSFVSDATATGNGFTLEFEGIGRNINRNTLYKHFHVDDWAGSFSSDNITGSQIPSPTSKRLFSTVVINPQYKNVTRLNVNITEGSVQLKPEECEKSALNFYNDILEAKSSASRCCGKTCEKSALTNADGIFLATLSSDLKSTNSFKFSWDIDINDVSVESVSTCGGILAGRVGRISYKSSETYESNERCVWAIQLTTKSKIKLTVLNEEIEDGYDFLTVTNVEDNFAADSKAEPTTTILKSSNTFNFSGPVVLVTFTSDSSGEGKGFELIWGEVGSNLKEDAVPTGVVYLGEESGTKAVTIKSPAYEVVVINPKYKDGSSLSLKLNKVKPDLGKNCGVSGLTLFGNDQSNYSVAHRYCQDTGDNFHPEEFQALGGVFVLAYRAEGKDESEIDFTWQKGSPPAEVVLEGDQVVEQTEGCGGVLVGDSGKIDYKLNVPYANNERCTWIIESARRSKLTLKLLKDGFESCCDYLMVTPLVPENGTVSKNSIRIDRENKLHSFSGPVAVTFNSDGSLGESGFSLGFSTGGAIQENPVKYTHNILKETSGSISYPSENQVLQLKNEIVTYVFSPETLLRSDVLQTNVTIDVNNLGVDKECSKDSLSFSETPVKEGSISKRFTCAGEDLAGESSSCGCPAEANKVSETLTLNNRGFIVVLKSVESNEGKSFNFNWTSSTDPEETEGESTSTVPEVEASTTPAESTT